MSRLSRGFTAFLDLVERVGNVLPHPASLFAIFALLVILLSGILAGLDLEVAHPSTGEPIRPVSLLNVSGLHLVLTRMVTNFTGFAPLGTVFVSMLGIGLASVIALMLPYTIVFAQLVGASHGLDPPRASRRTGRRIVLTVLRSLESCTLGRRAVRRGKLCP